MVKCVFVYNLVTKKKSINKWLSCNERDIDLDLESKIMTEFILKIGSKMRSLPSTSFSRFQENIIKEKVLDHLNLKDLGKLNDKLDGVSYFKSISRKLFSYSFVLKYLNEKEINLNKIDLKNFIPSIDYRGQEYRIITSDFGEYPVLDYKDTTPFIFVASKSNLDFIIIGYSSIEVLKDKSNYDSTLSNRMVFKAIEKLTPITNGI